MLKRAAGACAAVPLATLLAGLTWQGRSDFCQMQSMPYDCRGWRNGIGPNLNGVMGKKHGSSAGFAYSEAVESPGNWDWENMDKWLAKPEEICSRH